MNLTETEVVLEGLWTTVDRLQHGLHTASKSLEWFNDRIPPEHRLEAALRLDAFNKMLNAVDALVAPIRAAMETEVRNGKGSKTK